MKAQVQRQILPLGMEAVLKLRNNLWLKSSWGSREGMNAKGVWIAIGLGFDSGSRISNLTLPDGKNGADHCIRAGDVKLTVLNRTSGANLTVSAGNEFRRSAISPGAEVTFASMTYWTSQTKNETVTLDAKDHGDLLLLNDLVEWTINSKVESDDPFTTRYWHGTKRTVIRKEVREAIKRVCSQLGLPQKHFSTRSLRSGFATHYKKCHGDTEHRNVRGGWAPGSMVPDNNYDFDVPRGISR